VGAEVIHLYRGGKKILEKIFGVGFSVESGEGG
jgi:hypothetical protein